MTQFTHYLLPIQVIVAVLLIILVLLQPRGTGLGSAFGGAGGLFATRRGVQQKLYWITIVLAFVFVALAFSNLIVK